MKRIPAILFTFLVVLVFNSCDDKDENYRKIFVSIPQEYLGSPFDPAVCWVFITDQNGDPIDQVRINSAGTIVLRIPETIADETVTLNFYNVRYHITTRKDLVSLGGIAPGSYQISIDQQPVRTIGQAEITLNNLPPDIEVTVSGDAGDYQIDGNAITTKIFGGLHPKPSVLLSTFDNGGGEGRYSFPDVEDGSSIALDYTTLTNFNKSQIPPIKDSAFVIQTGFKDGIEYQFRNSQIQFTASGIPLYYSNVFDSYLTTINIHDHYDLLTNVSFGSTLPTSFNALDVTAELTLESYPSFKVHLTGNADLVETRFEYIEDSPWPGLPGMDYSETKTYYMPFANVVWFHHPKLPEEIIEFHGQERGTHDVQEVIITDFDDFSDYSDFINYRLNGNNFTGIVKSNARSKRINLR
jgi:hypothetical protein